MPPPEEPPGAVRGAGRSDAIDILKALAIVLMLVQHTVPGHDLAAVGRNTWIRVCVPIFFVIMGMNLIGSWERSRRAGTAEFLMRRLDRIVGPFLVVLALAYVIAAVRGDLDPSASWAVGALPISAPGNYFVTAFVGIVLLFPALAWAFRRSPFWTLVGCILVDVAVEVVLLHTGSVADRLRAGGAPYYFPAFPLRYLGAVALGMWVAVDGRRVARRNLPIGALAAPSFAFLLALDLGADPLSWFPDSYEKAMSVFGAPWAALLVLVGLRVLPRDVGSSLPGRALVTVGRVSWHVYLVQLVWLGAVVDNHRSLAAAPLNIAVCILLGWLLFLVVPDTRLASRRTRDAPASA